MYSPIWLKVSSAMSCFFYFLISRNVIYTNGYSMHEKHRANPENTKMKNKEKTKKKTNP